MMKRLFCIPLAALAALLLSSCEREFPVFQEDSDLVTVTLTADKAGDETRAAAVEGADKVSYEWTGTDLRNLKLFKVTPGDHPQEGEVLTAVGNVTTSLSSDSKVLSVTATVAAGSTLRAVVASEWTGSATHPQPKLPSVQHPAENNFDPDADILVSEDVTVSALNDAKLAFHRPVSVNKMTLKGLNSGEKVEKVTLSSVQHLTGCYSYESGGMTGQETELTLEYLSGTVKAGELYPVYFAAIPEQGHELTLTVETMKDSKLYRYTKVFGTVNFTRGKFSIFNVDLTDLGEEVGAVDYSGEWVIGGMDSGHCIAAKNWTGGYVYPAKEVEIEGEVVTVPGTKDSYKMTVSLISTGDQAGRYTIRDAGGKYLSATGGTSSNNMTGLSVPAASSYWIISKNADGTYDINADNLDDYARKSMRLNWNGGKPRVTCYKMDNTAQSKVTLYPFEKVLEAAGN